jgi:molecular chaperone GrpE (heat shock protein)
MNNSINITDFLIDKNIIDSSDGDITINKNGKEISLNDVINEYIEIYANDKYLRTLAEFENYKKRVRLQKEQLEKEVTEKAIKPVIEIHNDLLISINKTDNTEAKNNFKILYDKLTKSLMQIDIEVMQTDEYDSDIHDVIAVVPSDEEGTFIDEVLSNGYTLKGKPIIHPKVILKSNG